MNIQMSGYEPDAPVRVRRTTLPDTQLQFSLGDALSVFLTVTEAENLVDALVDILAQIDSTAETPAPIPA